MRVLRRQKELYGRGDHVCAGEVFDLLALGCGSQSEQFPAGHGTEGLFVLASQCPDEFIVTELAFVVAGRGASVLQSGQHEHAAGRAASEAHTTYSSAKTSSHAHGLVLGYAVQIAASADDSLRTVEALSEELLCPLHASLDVLFREVFHMIIQLKSGAKFVLYFCCERRKLSRGMV